MNPFKPLVVATLLALSVSLPPPSAAADKSVEQSLSDANKEGRIWAGFALNRHLNPFEFDIKVNGETATLAGTVDESIDKELAEQVALGVSGIKKVVNNVTVDPDWAPKPQPAGERGFRRTAEDATITATVKSKLLWSEHTDGLDINVDTTDGVVTLRGKVPSTESATTIDPAMPSDHGALKVNVVRPSRPMKTVRPEKSTARPAVAIATPSASGTSRSRSSSRNRLTTNSE